MKAPKKSVEAYASAVDRQAEEAARMMSAYIDSLDFSGDYESRKAARDLAIEYFRNLVRVYGDAAATIAADFYEELAEAAGEHVERAVLAELADESLDGSARYAARNLFGRDSSVLLFRQAMERSIARFVKKMANDTMSLNAARDGGRRGVKFARVPTGAETCAFCIMLASRGFVYASKETAGEFDHFHDNCDCKIVPGFGDDAGIEGYDPDEYLRFYRESIQRGKYGVGVDVKGTINAMRRELYPQVRDERNARRREIYRIRKEAEAENAEADEQDE